MHKYTIEALSPEVYQLNPVSGGTPIQVSSQHPKWKTVQAAAQAADRRLVNISDKGRWNTSKDYTNQYSTVAPVTTPTSSIVVKFTQLQDLQIDDSLFQPMKTGTIFDKFLSTDGGLLPASNVMAAGAPGVGKTTVLLEMLARLQQAGKSVLFISAEMSEMDMARYLRRFPSWATLPILFLNNYDQAADKVIEAALLQGWDAVLTDSYTEVNDTVKDHTGWSRGKTEKWFLDLMTQHNKGLANHYTAFITILQLSKGGNFVGSNKLKHLTSAMMTLDWHGGENSGQRYMQFQKNRLGEVGQKLFFNLRGGVQFEEARYQRDLFNDHLIQQEQQQLEAEGQNWDRIFGLEASTVDAEPVTPTIN